VIGPDDRESYEPPYEAGEGGLEPNVEPEGEERNFRESQVLREPDLPEIPRAEDHPTGGVDRRGESGDQGDDELKNFRVDREEE
jgi:hypothetical protein